MKFLSIISIIVLSALSCTQLNHTLIYNGTSQSGKHARGLAVQGSKIVITGYKGAITMVDRSTENYYKVKDSIQGAEDLRGVHLFSDFSYVTINSGNNGIVYRNQFGTINAVFEGKGLFLDGIDFWSDEQTGLIYGDQVDGKMLILKTLNGGRDWYPIDRSNIPDALPNEAGFAASGTGLQVLADSIAYFATGAGDTARLFKSVDRGEHWSALNTPMRSGKSYGIYSLHFWSANEGVIVGGSYADTTYHERIAFYTADGGESWTNISKGLPGYMSCIASNSDGSLLIATGRMGTYYSLNKGKSWQQFSQTPYYTVNITDDLIVCSGRNGIFKIYRFNQ